MGRETWKGSKEVLCADLFCGAGGLTYGLSKEGLSVAVGIDIDESCRYPYETNNSSEFYTTSIEDLSPKILLKFFIL